MISKELLDILCCPETKADLILDNNTLVSTDKNTRRRYRIEDDIPVMLIDESERLSLEEWREIMKKHGKAVEQLLVYQFQVLVGQFLNEFLVLTDLDNFFSLITKTK